MKSFKKTTLMILPLMLLALSVQAHDPKEHMKDKQKPDCAAMKDMDHTKMDMKDPVVQAMMKQCMKESHHKEGEAVEKQDSNESNDDNESNNDNEAHH